MRRLWYHGKVDTMVPGKDRQQAIGLEDGAVVFVGSDRDALALPWDEKTDLEGRQVLPGFHDTHMHLLLYALFQDSLPLAGVPSIQEMIRRGRDKLAQTGASYLLGMAGTKRLWPRSACPPGPTWIRFPGKFRYVCCAAAPMWQPATPPCWSG